MELLLKEIYKDMKKQEEAGIEEIGPATMLAISYYYPEKNVGKLRQLMKLDLETQKELDYLNAGVGNVRQLSSDEKKELILTSLKSAILKSLVKIEIGIVSKESESENGLMKDKGTMFLKKVVDNIEKQNIDSSLLDDIQSSDKVIGKLKDKKLKKLACYIQYFRDKFWNSDLDNTSQEIYSNLNLVLLYELYKRDIFPLVFEKKLTYAVRKYWQVVIKK